MPFPKHWLPILKLLLAMVSIQTGASVAKGLFAQMQPPGVTALRLVFAAIMMLAAFRPWRHSLTWRALAPAAGYGAALGVMNFTFYLAIQRIPLGVGVALEFLGPLGVTLALSRRLVDFFWVGLAATGVVLLSPLMGTASLDPVGVAWALVAAAGWAVYILLGKRATADMRGETTAAVGMGVAALTMSPVGFVMAPEALTQWQVWPAVAAVALLSSALPYSLEMIALKQMTPRSFGLLMSLEPAMGAMGGWVLLDEALLPQHWLAIACIVVASGGSALRRREVTATSVATVSRHWPRRRRVS